MNHVRTIGALRFAAAVALTFAGTVACKSETSKAPGANQEELGREGSQSAHDHAGAQDKTMGMPGATSEEVNAEQKNTGDESAKKDTTLSTPGESLGEAKGKGLVPGQGGGPIDTARPSTKKGPAEPGKGDRDHTLETPGADEKEVHPDDVQTSPMAPNKP